MRPRILSYRMLVPVWFLCVGVVAMSSPPPTVAIGVLLLVTTVIVIPALMVIVRPRPQTRP